MENTNLKTSKTFWESIVGKRAQLHSLLTRCWETKKITEQQYYAEKATVNKLLGCEIGNKMAEYSKLLNQQRQTL